tara:strand:+ start:520 stop:864 length:345 start_codon:yes stop_codon:yes gene_type:complete
MDWNKFLNETKHSFNTLEKQIPEIFRGFNVMGQEAKKNGALNEKTKEFIALGIAIATRCDSCIAFHVKSLVRLKTTRDEIVEALSMCSYMGGGPSIAFSAKALEAFDQFSNSRI